ncbi:hypothetical protein MATL_G00237170 [Megalops atlanticus]|uniref:Uncharacterized protein n=1 Tax=Megalops atlanticus TaxID=7932 RepID=A0A9D3SVE8_MEGAT|nr:hypothetical protein MATL_G00237170 [Megalops atlanticus]
MPIATLQQGGIPAEGRGQNRAQGETRPHRQRRQPTETLHTHTQRRDRPDAGEMTQSLQTQKLPGLGAPFPYSTQGGSYSVQTPYGFQLDLDFLKYVEEIESGCKLRRPCKLSQKSSGAGGCPRSWRVRASPSPASSEDGQGGPLEHTPPAPSKALSRPPSSVVGTETPPPPAPARALLTHGHTEPGQGAKTSPRSLLSGDGSSARDVHLQLDPPAGSLRPPRSSTPDPPAELGVALQQLRQMEERVRGMVDLEREVGELRAERDRLLQALQGDPGTQERPLPAGGVAAGGRGEPCDRERPPHPASHAHSRVQAEVRRRVREGGEGERSERVPETGGVEAERRAVAVGDNMPLEGSAFRREVRDAAVGTVTMVTCETGVGTDETERCEVGVQVRVDTAEVSLMTESESDEEVSARQDTLMLQRESIRVLEARLGQAQREREALRRSGREAEKEAFTSSYRSRSQEPPDTCSDEAERRDSTPRRNDQQTQTETWEWAGEETSPAVTSRGSQWESPHEEDELAVSIVTGGEVTTAGEGTVSVTEREEGSSQETRPFRPPAGVLKSIMKRRDETGSADPGRKKSLQFVGILNGGYESTSSEEEEDEELEEGSSSSTGGAGVFSDSSEGDMELLEDTSSEERNISLEDSDSDPEEAARGESDDSDEKFELNAKMRDAFLVLRGHLDDDASTLNGEDVLSCSRTVRLEWFRISSGPSARPAHLASFLSAFSEAFPGLQEGVVNMTDSNGNSALHYSVSHSNSGVVSLLLDTGVCHVDRRNRAGYTAIMLAALASVRGEEDMQVVRRLFSAGDVNAKASQAGQTALMLAVSHGRQEMVQVLLDCGADVNAQDDEGSTALMCASEHGRTDITSLLLQHPGCDCSLVDNDGSNALSIAMEASHGDIAVLLYAHMNSSGALTARTCQPMPGSPTIPKKTRTQE